MNNIYVGPKIKMPLGLQSLMSFIAFRVPGPDHVPQMYRVTKNRYDGYIGIVSESLLRTYVTILSKPPVSSSAVLASMYGAAPAQTAPSPYPPIANYTVQSAAPVYQNPEWDDELTNPFVP